MLHTACLIPRVRVLSGLLCTASLMAQGETRPTAGDALLEWVGGFEAGKFTLRGRVALVKDCRIDYVRVGIEAGALEPSGTRSRTVSHFALLQRLVTKVEEQPSVDSARALLAVAATGFAYDMFNHEQMMIRDLGHFALLRMDEPVVWQHLYQVATTELVKKTDKGLKALPGALDVRMDFDIASVSMWRVAAIRLLGQKNKSVFRSAIEKCLGSPDPRVRLAASESLTSLHKPQSILPITEALATEEHPMVVVGLVQAIQKILNKHALKVPEEQSERALQVALGRINQVDWRTDMAVVQLMHNHPIKAAVEPLIRLLRQSKGEVDPILKIINEHASLYLGLEAHRALKRITGAVMPPDPERWEEFWAANGEQLKVRRFVPADKSKTFVPSGGGSFYGIPVLGNEVVFVIDTSGSMKAKVVAEVPSGRRGKTVRMRGTRLQVAVRQTLRAIQGMPRNSKFSIVSFDSNVRAWNAKPVKIGGNARSVAAAALGRLRPNGGTNVFDALVHVLEAKEMGYGSRPTSNVDEIFVLSDGQPSGGMLTDPKEILKVVAEINRIRKVRIHTVFAGPGTGSGAAFLRELAEQNGGQFVHQ